MPPVILAILDGWGIATGGPGNAITLAKTPNFDRLWAVYPRARLNASGEAVGLTRGEDGNSETGHLNLGAGQIVFQDLPRIDLSIANGAFFKVSAFKTAADHVRRHSSALHLIGLASPAGVHSSLRHLFALLQLARQEKLSRVYLHLFTDGRDSSPTIAQTYLTEVEEECRKIGIGKIATLCGRYYGMDRDYHWERTQKAYELIVSGKGARFNSIKEAVSASYRAGKTDEFLEPVLLDPEGLVKSGDAVISYNFRIDRPRQLTKAIVLPDFENYVSQKAAFDPYAEKYGLKQYELPSEKTTTFRREIFLQNLLFVTMTEYEKNLPVRIAFEPDTVKLPLARVISEKGLRQFHIAETEKERFVTYYFNGQREQPFPGEDRVEIPSPDIPTYDLKPEMAAYEVTTEVLKRLSTRLYDFMVINFANPDMVGHTGVLSAGIRACEVVDDCLGKLVQAVGTQNGTVLVTADHGNVEEMINLQTGEVDTEHSSNPVPLIVAGPQFINQSRDLPQGVLADVAPTILHLMNIPKPDIMTGQNLLR